MGNTIIWKDKITRSKLFKTARENKDMQFRLIQRFGKSISKDSVFYGWRKVSKVKTQVILLKNQSGKETYLDLPFASLMEFGVAEIPQIFNGSKIVLAVYDEGYRPATLEEKRVMQEWIDRTRKQYLNYYAKLAYFQSRHMEYLIEDYRLKTEEVRTHSVKGDLVLLYEIKM